MGNHTTSCRREILLWLISRGYFAHIGIGSTSAVEDAFNQTEKSEIYATLYCLYN